ncbi:MAG: T9SS type A sorting domain-containing protein, partial [Lewinella sp.]|nr:T9SS type A sorting domain-containing protein [Lewinella sp.]
SFTVQLTVTDSLGAADVAEQIIALNNTPPQVEITSFADGDQYPLGLTSLLSLRAKVSDAEHDLDELTHEWRIFLHHNTHFHPEPPNYEPETYMLVTPIGCGDEEYFYRIQLTVTDPEGLATVVTQRIYPYCGEPFADWGELTAQPADNGVALSLPNLMHSDSLRIEWQRGKDFFHFEPLASAVDLAPQPAGAELTFFDPAPRQGANIYRVKLVHPSGAFAYTNLATVSYPPPRSWKVYPNPARRVVHFSIEETMATDLEIELFDVSGQRLRTAHFETQAGTSWEEPLLLEGLGKGVYLYRITNGPDQYLGRLILQ